MIAPHLVPACHFEHTPLGHAAMFIFWAVCTVGYFLVAAFWLPETKGRTLERIEAGFATKR